MMMLARHRRLITRQETHSEARKALSELELNDYRWRRISRPRDGGYQYHIVPYHPPIPHHNLHNANLTHMLTPALSAVILHFFRTQAVNAMFPHTTHHKNQSEKYLSSALEHRTHAKNRESHTYSLSTKAYGSGTSCRIPF